MITAPLDGTTLWCDTLAADEEDHPLDADIAAAEQVITAWA